VEKADRIIVMHEGEVVESGTHAGLLARNGSYAALHRLQFSA
jgi:subfamily B ATP-binding cassette protein MsbA